MDLRLCSASTETKLMLAVCSNTAVQNGIFERVSPPVDSTKLVT
jgi:hypothetical protein